MASHLIKVKTMICHKKCRLGELVMIDNEWAVRFDRYAWSLWHRKKVKSQHESSVWVEREWTLTTHELSCSIKAYEELKPEITFFIRLYEGNERLRRMRRKNGKNY